jgi:hypothetical protein
MLVCAKLCLGTWESTNVYASGRFVFGIKNRNVDTTTDALLMNLIVRCYGHTKERTSLDVKDSRGLTTLLLLCGDDINKEQSRQRKQTCFIIDAIGTQESMSCTPKNNYTYTH